MISITKLLAIAAIIIIIYYVFFRGKKTTADNANEAETKNDDKKLEDTMVECAKCSTFVSQKEAIIKDGKYFCSKECALS